MSLHGQVLGDGAATPVDASSPFWQPIHSASCWVQTQAWRVRLLRPSPQGRARAVTRLLIFTRDQEPFRHYDRGVDPSDEWWVPRGGLLHCSAAPWRHDRPPLISGRSRPHHPCAFLDRLAHRRAVRRIMPERLAPACPQAQEEDPWPPPHAV